MASPYNLLNPTDDQSVLGVKNPSPDLSQAIVARNAMKWSHVNSTVKVSGVSPPNPDHATVRKQDMPTHQKTR